ncbi:outer membrane protein assembly factor [Nitrincola tapanii]|uniref:Translocation and assembly module subunit TamA n=1 Tax=Nitrincola tapanii TaxID=1708751 RepID=A0A5A9W4G9_9GAMM|nr:outer membrane protein assembly factor [Nitrincola tapanii]
MSDALADNVRGFLSIQSLEDQDVRSESRLRYLHRQAEGEIRQALEPFGYYTPQIETELQRLDSGDWQARYRIDPGVPTRVSRVEIQLLGEAADDSAFQSLLATRPLRRGAILSHQDYERLKTQLQSLAAERGYYQSRFQQQRILVDPEAAEAEIDLVFDSGTRARVGEIRFAESPLDERLLRRYPRFAEGDYLDVTRLVDLQGALIDSDYFSDVEVRPLLDEMEEGVIPVQVNLTPRLRTLYSAGFGFGTDTGARMQLGMNRRYINSRGHKLDARLRFSEIRNDLSGSYMIPGRDPRFDLFGLRARYADENSDTIESSTLALGGVWQRQIGDWERVLSLDFEQEEFTFDQNTQTVKLLIPRAQLSRTLADNRFNTRAGQRISFSLAAANDALLSDVSFIQVSASGKRVDSFGERWRLLSRLEVGATLADEFDRLPASQRFYAGGDNSIRGYDYQTLGPKSAQGNVIGGRYLLVSSLEADYEFRPNWRLAGFIDAGNAFDGWSDPIKTSLGFGVRWQSPVGPIRVDLATPIQDSGVRIHFTLGPDL